MDSFFDVNAICPVPLIALCHIGYAEMPEARFHVNGIRSESEPHKCALGAASCSKAAIARPVGAT
jgi:hypothetical protein